MISTGVPLTIRDLNTLIEQSNREAARINAHCGNNRGAQNGGNQRNGVGNDVRNTNRGKTNKNRNSGIAKKKPSGNTRTKR
jgi:hypothetical protein